MRRRKPKFAKRTWNVRWNQSDRKTGGVLISRVATLNSPFELTVGLLARQKPTVGKAPTWLPARSGHYQSQGAAPQQGSLTPLPLGEPICVGYATRTHSTCWPATGPGRSWAHDQATRIKS